MKAERFIPVCTPVPPSFTPILKQMCETSSIYGCSTPPCVCLLRPPDVCCPPPHIKNPKTKQNPAKDPDRKQNLVSHHPHQHSTSNAPDSPGPVQRQRRVGWWIPQRPSYATGGIVGFLKSAEFKLHSPWVQSVTFHTTHSHGRTKKSCQPKSFPLPWCV